MSTRLKHVVSNIKVLLTILALVILVSFIWSQVGSNVYVSNTLHVMNVSALILSIRAWLATRHSLTKETTRVLKLEEEAKESRSFLTQSIVNNSNFNHNLANVVAGINHELSPWIGGTINILTSLKERLASEAFEHKARFMTKIDLALEALKQSAKIMSVVSKNIKHLKLHSNDKSNLKATVESWIGILFINEVIKRNIEFDQIEVDYKSIDFEITHSPMLLSQVFLNLIKNTIDHNPKFLSTIKIKIHGVDDRILVIEDNGKGVSDDMLPKLFYPEVTTKNDGEIHGLGLSICKEYCKLMCASITAEQVTDGGLRFYIEFDSEYTSGLRQIQTS